jgi:uncharacterized protein YjiS (DUF1127 family)
MSGYTSAPRPFRPPLRVVTHAGEAIRMRPSARPSLRAWAQALWARLVLMHRTAETRRQLGTLAPRLLADIGLTRAEAAAEAERWPWDLDSTRAPGRPTGPHR